ncbi:MAG: zinc ribbon domain-containing protein [Candidatus Omnitrophica bacterium]|nr:zinc ribbon domain-containing protein [Candidatus Omnitrophota bacterium]
MPLYVYEIILPGGKSGKRFEIIQKFSDPPLKKHPKTGKPVRRVVTLPAILGNRFDKTVKSLSKKDKKFVRNLKGQK